MQTVPAPIPTPIQTLRERITSKVLELRAEGIDIAVILRQLGHASLLTTVRYLDHLEPESVVTRIAQRHPEDE